MPEHQTAEAQITTDHDEIRRWAESRGGKPAAVKATHRGKDPGIIRLIFPDAPNADDESLEEISWDEFFRKFDEAGLALLYQDKTSGGEKSLFNKLIGRETAEARRHGESHASRHQLSPGMLVMGHAIEQASAEGAACFDFLRGDENYKYGWGAVDRSKTSRHLSRR